MSETLKALDMFLGSLDTMQARKIKYKINKDNKEYQKQLLADEREFKKEQANVSFLRDQYTRQEETLDLLKAEALNRGMTIDNLNDVDDIDKTKSATDVTSLSLKNLNLEIEKQESEVMDLRTLIAGYNQGALNRNNFDADEDGNVSEEELLAQGIKKDSPLWKGAMSTNPSAMQKLDIEKAEIELEDKKINLEINQETKEAKIEDINANLGHKIALNKLALDTQLQEYVNRGYAQKVDKLNIQNQNAQITIDETTVNVDALSKNVANTIVLKGPDGKKDMLASKISAYLNAIQEGDENAIGNALSTITSTNVYTKHISGDLANLIVNQVDIRPKDQVTTPIELNFLPNKLASTLKMHDRFIAYRSNLIDFYNKWLLTQTENQSKRFNKDLEYEFGDNVTIEDKLFKMLGTPDAINKMDSEMGNDLVEVMSRKGINFDTNDFRDAIAYGKLGFFTDDNLKALKSIKSGISTIQEARAYQRTLRNLIDTLSE